MLVMEHRYKEPAGRSPWMYPWYLNPPVSPFTWLSRFSYLGSSLRYRTIGENRKIPFTTCLLAFQQLKFEEEIPKTT